MNNSVRILDKPHIIIIGAGFGGLTLASELDRLAEEGKAQVTLIDKNSGFTMGFSMQWAMMDRRRPEDGGRLYSSLKPGHIRFIQDEVTSIETDKFELHTKSLHLNYDYLVIAAGTELSMESITGTGENIYNLCELHSVMKLKNALGSITEGTVVIMVASTPFKCPPAPYEYAFLIDEILRQKNVRNKIRLLIT